MKQLSPGLISLFLALTFILVSCSQNTDPITGSGLAGTTAQTSFEYARINNTGVKLDGNTGVANTTSLFYTREIDVFNATDTSIWVACTGAGNLSVFRYEVSPDNINWRNGVVLMNSANATGGSLCASGNITVIEPTEKAFRYIRFLALTGQVINTNTTNLTVILSRK